MAKDQKYKAIIFDLGGIILKSVSKPLALNIEQLFKIPRKKVRETYYKYLGEWELDKISEEEYWKKFSKDLKIKIEIFKLKKIYRSLLIAKSEVLKLIKYLRHKYKIALLTDVNREAMNYIKKKYRLNNFFDVIVTSYEFGLAKPRIKKFLQKDRRLNYSRIYELVIRKLKVRPTECIFIDDRKENLLPAKKLGMKTILFRNINQLKKRLATLGIKNVH